jgi:hypothetical protein
MTMTEKGKKRARNIIKGAGVFVKVVADIEDLTKNKIIIEMYDKN